MIEITDANFKETVLSTEKVVLLDFWAEWCGPCHALNKVLREVAPEYEGAVLFGKVNTDYASEVTVSYGVRNMPTLLFLKGGEVVDKQVGAVPSKVIRGKLDALLTRS